MSNDPHVVVGLYTQVEYTVATLPAAASMQGERLWVSDLSVNPLVGANSTAAGGGTNRGKVYSTGSAWKIANYPRV